MEEELYNKERFIKEYNDIKKRADKIESFLCRHTYKELELGLKFPAYLLEDQVDIMNDYLNILEKRAKYEGIKLE